MAQGATPAGGVGATGLAPVGDALGVAVRSIVEFSTALSSVPAAVTSFVAAFNPAVVEVMATAFRDLAATIGYGLEPVIQAATEIVRELAGAFGRVFEQLRPLVSELSATLINVLVPLIQAAAVVFEALLRVVEALMPVIRLLAAVLEGVVTLFAAVIQIGAQIIGAVLEALFGSMGGLREATDAVKNAFVQATVAVIRFVDAVLRFFGFTALADRILSSFTRAADSGKRAAPRDVGIASAADVYQQRLVEAAKAGGGADPMERQVSIMEQVREAVEGIQRDVRGARESVPGGWAAAEAMLLRIGLSLLLPGGVRWT